MNLMEVDYDKMCSAKKMFLIIVQYVCVFIN